MILLTEYFQSDPARRKEFDVCLSENIKNDSIKQIILFIDNPSVNPTDNFLESDKIRIHRTPGRPTYQDFFIFCNSKLSGETCIIANADIIVGKDIDKAESHPDFGNMFIALTRWDLSKKEDGTFSSTFFDNHRGIARVSQDTWVFKSPIRIAGCNFPMGKPGCDNKVAHIAKNAGYIVTNPSLQIKTYHLHESGIRKYNGSDVIPPPWQMVPPTDDINTFSELTEEWPF
jgi:hypothetical protein